MKLLQNKKSTGYIINRDGKKRKIRFRGGYKNNSTLNNDKDKIDIFSYSIFEANSLIKKINKSIYEINDDKDKIIHDNLLDILLDISKTFDIKQLTHYEKNKHKFTDEKLLSLLYTYSIINDSYETPTLITGDSDFTRIDYIFKMLMRIQLINGHIKNKLFIQNNLVKKYMKIEKIISKDMVNIYYSKNIFTAANNKYFKHILDSWFVSKYLYKRNYNEINRRVSDFLEKHRKELNGLLDLSLSKT